MATWNQKFVSSFFRLASLCVLVILQFSIGYANTHEADSLIAILNGESHPDQRGELLLKLSKIYQDLEHESALSYAKEAYDWSIEKNNRNIEGLALKAIGTQYLVKWELEESLEYLFKAIELLERYATKEALQGCLNTIGSAYFRKGDIEVAMAYFDKAINVLEVGSQNELTAGILGNIANIHFTEGDLDKALKYSHQALELNRKINNPNGIALTLTNLGSQYTKRKNYAKAISCYEEALEIIRSTNNKRLEILVLMNLGNRYTVKEEFDKAMRYFESALAISDKLGDDAQKGKTLYNIASLQKRLKKYDEAINSAKQALEISNKIGNKKWTLYSYNLLIKCYQIKNDYKQAFKYKSLYHIMQDSLFSVEKSTMISEISTKYETKKKDAENQVLKDQQLKNEAIIGHQKIIGLLIALVLVLTLSVLGILYRNYKSKIQYSIMLEKEVAMRTADLEKSNVRLRETNRELERFTFIASHDLKEPLRSIMSFTNLLKRRLPEEIKSDEDISQYLGFISNSTKQLHSLIENVLEYSNLRSSEPSIRREYLRDTIGAALSSISDTINDLNVEIEISSLPSVIVDHLNIAKVLKILISNGIKFNDSSHPFVLIEPQVVEGVCQIAITDNGIGIDEKYHDQIFEMFKRLHDRQAYEGSGLGLAICKKIMSNMNGDIQVSSRVGEGSTFTITFPIEGES